MGICYNIVVDNMNYTNKWLDIGNKFIWSIQSELRMEKRKHSKAGEDKRDTTIERTNLGSVMNMSFLP